MQSCPTCRLLLESVDWHGMEALACRSCGGAWLRSADLPVALVDRRADLSELNALYPGAGTTASYAGLSAPCPDCYIELVSQPLTLAPSEQAPTCPTCGGIWLDPETRSRLAEVHVPPEVPADIRRLLPVVRAEPAPDSEER